MRDDPVYRVGEAIRLEIARQGISEDIDPDAVARVALRAMRAPTEAMVDAGQEAYEADYATRLNDADLTAAFRAMIDAALASPSTPEGR